MGKTTTPIDPMRSRVECDHVGEPHQANGSMVKCGACGCTWYEGQTPPPYVFVKLGA